MQEPSRRTLQLSKKSHQFSLPTLPMETKATGANPSVHGAVVRKPALADITNTIGIRERENRNVAEIMKENAAVLKLLAEKDKVIELSGLELRRLRLALHKANQQNWQLAQAHTQALVELNLGKDRIKVLQHELACTAAVLRAKNSELQGKGKVTTRQLPKKINSEQVQGVSADVKMVRSHSTDDNKAPNGNGKRSAETKSCVPPPDVIHHEAPPGKANRRKSMGRGLNNVQSCETRKESKTEDTNFTACSLSSEPSHEDRRKSTRRRSARLNPGLCDEPLEDSSKIEEDTKISACSLVDEPLHEDVPSAPSCSNISVRQAKNHKQSDYCGSSKSPNQEQPERLRSSVGRPLRKAAEKVISYQEMSRKVKLRRVD